MQTCGLGLNQGRPHGNSAVLSPGPPAERGTQTAASGEATLLNRNDQPKIETTDASVACKMYFQ